MKQKPYIRSINSGPRLQESRFQSFIYEREECDRQAKTRSYLYYLQMLTTRVWCGEVFNPKKVQLIRDKSPLFGTFTLLLEKGSNL